jgi:hypothetical protein
MIGEISFLDFLENPGFSEIKEMYHCCPVAEEDAELMLKLIPYLDKVERKVTKEDLLDQTRQEQVIFIKVPNFFSFFFFSPFYLFRKNLKICCTNFFHLRHVPNRNIIFILSSQKSKNSDWTSPKKN